MGKITLSMLWTWLLAACGGIAVIAKAAEILRRYGRNELIKNQKHNKRRIRALEAKDKQRRDTERMLMRALLALVNHSIDGNGIEGLKQTRGELTDFLTGH